MSLLFNKHVQSNDLEMRHFPIPWKEASHHFFFLTVNDLTSHDLSIRFVLPGLDGVAGG